MKGKHPNDQAHWGATTRQLRPVKRIPRIAMHRKIKSLSQAVGKNHLKSVNIRLALSVCNCRVSRQLCLGLAQTWNPPQPLFLVFVFTVITCCDHRCVFSQPSWEFGGRATSGKLLFWQLLPLASSSMNRSAFRGISYPRTGPSQRTHKCTVRTTTVGSLLHITIPTHMGQSTVSCIEFYLKWYHLLMVTYVVQIYE